MVTKRSASPWDGCVRWSYRWAADHLGTAFIGGLVIPLIAAALVDERHSGKVATVVAFGGVALTAFAFALVVAPYMQRNELRRRVSRETVLHQLETHAELIRPLIDATVTAGASYDEWQRQTGLWESGARDAIARLVSEEDARAFTDDGVTPVRVDGITTQHKEWKGHMMRLQTNLAGLIRRIDAGEIEFVGEPLRRRIYTRPEG